MARQTRYRQRRFGGSTTTATTSVTTQTPPPRTSTTAAPTTQQVNQAQDRLLAAKAKYRDQRSKFNDRKRVKEEKLNRRIQSAKAKGDTGTVEQLRAQRAALKAQDADSNSRIRMLRQNVENAERQVAQLTGTTPEAVRQSVAPRQQTARTRFTDRGPLREEAQRQTERRGQEVSVEQLRREQRLDAENKRRLAALERRQAFVQGQTVRASVQAPLRQLPPQAQFQPVTEMRPLPWSPTAVGIANIAGTRVQPTQPPGFFDRINTGTSQFLRQAPEPFKLALGPPGRIVEVGEGLQTAGRTVTRAGERLRRFDPTPSRFFAETTIGAGGILTGAGREAAERPVTTGLTAVGGFGLGAARTAVLRLGAGSRAVRYGVGALEIGATGAYAGSVGYDFFTARGSQAKGRVLGESAVQVGAFGLGFRAGQPFGVPLARGARRVRDASTVYVPTGQRGPMGEIIAEPRFRPFQAVADRLPTLGRAGKARVGGSGKKARRAQRRAQRPKTKAQRQKESLRQAYDPRITFDRGQFVQRSRAELARETGVREVVVRRDPAIQLEGTPITARVVPGQVREVVARPPRRGKPRARKPRRVVDQFDVRPDEFIAVSRTGGRTKPTTRKPTTPSPSSAPVQAVTVPVQRAPTRAVQRPAKRKARKKQEPVFTQPQRVAVVEEIIEGPPPRAFQQFRQAESQQFARGSPGARREQSLARLRQLQRQRTTTVRQQLPAIAGTRTISPTQQAQPPATFLRPDAPATFTFGPRTLARNPGTGALMRPGTRTGARGLRTTTTSIRGGVAEGRLPRSLRQYAYLGTRISPASTTAITPRIAVDQRQAFDVVPPDIPRPRRPSVPGLPSPPPTPKFPSPPPPTTFRSTRTVTPPPVPIPGITSSTTTTTTTTGRTPPYFPPFFGGGGFGYGGYAPGTTTRRGFKYTPSLFAQIFNVRGTKKQRARLQQQTFTGFEIRPLV